MMTRVALLLAAATGTTLAASYPACTGSVCDNDAPESMSINALPRTQHDIRLPRRRSNLQAGQLARGPFLRHRAERAARPKLPDYIAAVVPGGYFTRVPRTAGVRGLGRAAASGASPRVSDVASPAASRLCGCPSCQCCSSCSSPVACRRQRRPWPRHGSGAQILKRVRLGC